MTEAAALSSYRSHVAIARMIPNDVLYHLQGRRCFYCQRPLAPKSYTRDHLIPKHTGATLAGNKVLAHGTCNRLKNGRMPTAEEIERYRSIALRYASGGER